MRFKELKIGCPACDGTGEMTTRQWYEKEDQDDALLDGWKACLVRRNKKADADENNEIYRRLHSSKSIKKDN